MPTRCPRRGGTRSIGVAFYVGTEAGINIGAYIDTLVDNGSDFLGLSPEMLRSLGFGSDFPIGVPCGN